VKQVANKVLLFLILFISIFITGCWDKIELEEQAYIILIGLDKSDDKGLYEITYHIANPQGGGGNAVGQNPDEPPDQAITLKIPDILSGRDTAGSAIARKLTFSHLKFVIVSEELARSEDFFYNIDLMTRDPEIRRSVTIMITREKASDFIKAKESRVMTRPHKFYELMTGQLYELGLTSESTLHEYLSKTESDEDLFIAAYATAKEYSPVKGNEDEYIAGEINLEQDSPSNTQIMGSAVFKEGKMIGTITGEETKLSLMLRPDHTLKSIRPTYKDPLNKDYRISAVLEQRIPADVKMDLSNEVPKIYAKVVFYMHVIGIPSQINYVTNEKNRNLLKESIEKGLEDKFIKFINRTKREFEAQPFNWGNIARGRFLTVPQYIKYDWMKSYPNAEVSVDVDVEFRGFGKQLAPPNIEKVKD